MSKSRALRSVESKDLDSHVQQITKQLGIKFKSGNNLYRHEPRRGVALTLTSKGRHVHVTLQGLPSMPRIDTRAHADVGSEVLVDVVRRHLKLAR